MADRPAFLIQVEKKLNQLKSDINSALSKVSWDAQALKIQQQELESLYICPFNKNHKVPKESYKEHLNTCNLRVKNITQNKSDEASSTLFFYQKCPSVVSFVPADLPTFCTQLANDNCVAKELVSSVSTFANIPQQYRRFMIPQAEMMRFKGWILNLSGLPKEIAFSVFDAIQVQGVNLDHLWLLLFPELGQATETSLVNLWKLWFPLAWGLIPTNDIYSSNILQHEHQNIIYQNHANLANVQLSSPAQRLAAYDRIVMLSRKLRESKKVKRDNFAVFEGLLEKLNIVKEHQQNSQKKTYKDVLAQQRDYKRRRQRYKTKAASGKRTQTEVHRDLIALFMSDLELLSSIDL